MSRYNKPPLASRASRSFVALAISAILGVSGLAPVAEAQQRNDGARRVQRNQTNNAPARNFANVEVQALQVRDNIYMLVGAGGNVTVQFGEDGVLLVDTQFAEMSEKIIAAVRKLTDKPIRMIVNTHAHGDHIGGNANISMASRAVAGGLREETIGQAQIFAHERTMGHMSSIEEPAQQIPPVGMPTDTFHTELLEVFFNGEPIQMLHQPTAHTDGDIIVHFRSSDVISAGDVFRTDGYPVIDLQRGGTINGVIDALNTLIDITVPKENQEGGTLVIPGHGRLSDEYDVVVYRDMVTIIRDRIQDMIKKGMTLEQVKAARPTRDYDPVYGSNSGFWTTERFVEAVYRTLQPGS